MVLDPEGDVEGAAGGGPRTTRINEECLDLCVAEAKEWECTAIPVDMRMAWAVASAAGEEEAAGAKAAGMKEEAGGKCLRVALLLGSGTGDSTSTACWTSYCCWE